MPNIAIYNGKGWAKIKTREYQSHEGEDPQHLERCKLTGHLPWATHFGSHIIIDDANTILKCRKYCEDLVIPLYADIQDQAYAVTNIMYHTEGSGGSEGLSGMVMCYATPTFAWISTTWLSKQKLHEYLVRKDLWQARINGQY